MNNSSHNMRGFTLIEILVVIGIIAILSGIVIGALGGSKASARDARRLADLKNLQAAINLYIQDTGAPPAVSGWWAQLNNACTTGGWYPNPYSQLQPGYFGKLPEDPSSSAVPPQCVSTSGIWYWYGHGRSVSGSSLVVTDASKYVVCATLEKSNTPGYQTIPNPWGTTPALNYCLGN